MTQLPRMPLPGTIDPSILFEELVSWIASLIKDRRCPGIIIGISGTDSIVTALAYARAFSTVGMPDRVLGIHFGKPFPPANRTDAQIAAILSASPSYRAAPRLVIPWLSDQAPGASFLTDSSEDITDDHARWAAIFRASLNGADLREPLKSKGTYWVTGTRNATEQALGTFSNMSSAASVEPVVRLWKTDILRICEWLGVPGEVISGSRQVDCDCGRFDLAADHIEEIDLILAARAAGRPETELLLGINDDLLSRLCAFVDEQTAYAGFKKSIPYMPGKAGGDA